MKRFKLLATVFAMAMMVAGCGTAQPETDPSEDTAIQNPVEITLSDSKIQVNGSPAETTPDHDVYIGNDIVYYEADRDFTYGEGSAEDAHSAEAAALHTVVHITQPGAYRISGSLSKGQIAVDLGETAAEDPAAVVTLILNGTDITCKVAPAIIFYNVYECGSDDTDQASGDVDTSLAGANVIIADGTTNTINGAYVARIYQPDSVVLNEAGTEVEDAKKLHKYDGAFYSRMSMNVTGERENSGVLTINAENEGLDTELHLTINGGTIFINSGNDGINTNEDGVSVTTINGGALHIRVTGETGEGDGIDSNGWLVINGGTVTAEACAFSADAGIDSDMGIHINGGTVIATGHMLDRIEDGGQTYAVFSFADPQSGSDAIVLKDSVGGSVLETCPDNDYSILIYSSPDLTEGTYTLWSDGVQLTGQRGSMMGGPGMHGMMPDGGRPPEGEMPNGSTPPEPPQGMIPPVGGNPTDRPDGQQRPGGTNDNLSPELAAEFQISTGGNQFQSITNAE